MTGVVGHYISNIYFIDEDLELTTYMGPKTSKLNNAH